MISELTLAQRYTSFWDQCLPMRTEVTLAINNQLREQFSPPQPEPSRLVRWDLVSEISLRIFASLILGGRISKKIPGRKELHRISTEALEFVGRLQGPRFLQYDLITAKAIPYVSWPKQVSPRKVQGPNPTEKQEGLRLATCIAAFVRTYESRKTVVAMPLFDGCGIVDACQGDLLVGTTLYEVKAVNRGFHQTDWRQLIIYCALNFVTRRYKITHVGIVNPRSGGFFRADLEWLVGNAAGQDPAQLMSDVIDFISTDRVSA